MTAERWAPMTTELWAPIPGWTNYYEISTASRIRSLPRVVTRRDGRPYTVAARILRPRHHNHTGELTACLARDGRRTYVYLPVLMRDIFGSKEAA